MDVQECLAGEVQQPMLPLLEPILAHTTIIAAQSAVQQFEKLLGQFGGCSEHLRWQGLLSKLTVFTDAHKEPEISTQTSRSGTNAGTTSTVQHVLFSESRVSSLQAISAAQRQVFALGDLQHAMTLTANGKAADFSARQGVKLEVFVHRAVWLTGM